MTQPDPTLAHLSAFLWAHRATLRCRRSPMGLWIATMTTRGQEHEGFGPSQLEAIGQAMERGQ